MIFDNIQNSVDFGYIFKDIPEGNSIINSKSSEKFPDLSQAFSRESKQNVADSKNRDLTDPPLVKFKTLKIKKSRIMKDYFGKDLKKHLETYNEESVNLLNQEDDLNFLIFEDFNTTGILGEVNQLRQERNNGERNCWYSFVWYLGNVGKGLSGEDGGSEGEGRQVFSYISKIRSFYFLTIRKDDPENKLLMGLSFLRPHEIAGKTYESIGRWGVIGKSDNKNDICLPLSYKADASQNLVDNSKIIDFVEKELSLERGWKIGTSIIVPFYDPEIITQEKLIADTIDQYKVPILLGKLRVQINEIELNKDNIKTYIAENISSVKNYKSSQIINFLDFVEDSSKIKPENIINVKTNINERSISTENFDEETLQNCRKKFDEGEILKFNIPFSVTEKIKDRNSSKKFETKKTFFNLTIKKTLSGELGHEELIRYNLPISGERVLDNKDVYCFREISDPVASKFVKIFEGANHKKIYNTTDKVSEHYKEGSYYNTILLIKKSSEMIYKLLLDSSSEVDFTIASDFFNWKSDINEKKDEDDEGQDGTDVVDIDSEDEDDDKTVIPFRVSQINNENLNGIKLASKPIKEEDKKYLKYPYKCELKLAYVTEKGNAFNQYSDEDFNLSNNNIFSFKREGDITVTSQSENIVTLEIGSSNFNYQITGFEKLGEEDLKFKLRIIGDK